MVLYVSCADDYILNIRQRLILIAPKIEAIVVLGGLWLIIAIPGTAGARVWTFGWFAIRCSGGDTRNSLHHILCVHLYKFYLW